MNLQPLEPSAPLQLVCCASCKRPVDSADTLVDLDAREPGAYYCPRCAALIKIAQELNL